MKVSLPSAYLTQKSETARASEIGQKGLESLAPPSPSHLREEKPPLPTLPPEWWQSFLHGNPDAILSSEDARVAYDLIANKLGLEVGHLEFPQGIRSSRLRKLFYEAFGADLALHTMYRLWQAAANGD